MLKGLAKFGCHILKKSNTNTETENSPTIKQRQSGSRNSSMSSLDSFNPVSIVKSIFSNSPTLVNYIQIFISIFVVLFWFDIKLIIFFNKVVKDKYFRRRKKEQFYQYILPRTTCVTNGKKTHRQI